MNFEEATHARNENVRLLSLIDRENARVMPFWRDIHAGVFVTIYKRLPPSSENVYCCMSDGDYEPLNTLRDNIVKSAAICKTRDSRRIGGTPVAHELSLFAPLRLWRHLGNGERAKDEMVRAQQRAFMVRVANSRAVYLPDVWDERPSWSASSLLKNLTKKAGAAIDTSLRDIEVYEIPCFVIADDVVGVERHDRGFFSCVILTRCFDFYETFRSNDRLAYLISHGEAEYDNQNSFVRSFADVVAYVDLCKLLGFDGRADGVVREALKWKCADDDALCLAGHVSFLLQVEHSDRITRRDVELLLTFFQRSESSFTKPQIVIALVGCFKLFSAMQANIRDAARQFCESETEIAEAVGKDGAFAANWSLQALMMCKKILDAQVPATLERRLVNVCVEAVANPSSVTIQACAAQGLLVANKFDYLAFDWLAESLARLQYEWLAESKGGFRYRLHEPWYRTDVTSHVVSVCLLLLKETRAPNL